MAEGYLNNTNQCLEIVKREANGDSTIVKQVIGSFICVNVDIAKKNDPKLVVFL